MKKSVKNKAKRMISPFIGLLIFVAILVLICAVYMVIMGKDACITGRNNALGKVIEMIVCKP